MCEKLHRCPTISPLMKQLLTSVQWVVAHTVTDDFPYLTPSFERRFLDCRAPKRLSVAHVAPNDERQLWATYE